jgi:hypothetical protein
LKDENLKVYKLISAHLSATSGGVEDGPDGCLKLDPESLLQAVINIRASKMQQYLHRIVEYNV